MTLPDADVIPLAETSMAEWQPLPARARALFLGGIVPAFALPAAAAGLVLAAISDRISPWLGAPIGLLLGSAFGAWLGLKHYRHTYWRLDESGLAVRRGRMWQRETRVPATRVQHLDLKRGPWQRARNLATLVVHTAGTKHSAVSVPNLDADDAERLRDRLSCQIDHDDDA
jgi:membrane protein YdbS with pleckstrin-like domain